MAYDPGSLHLHADQERVAVAVGTDGNDSQSISGTLALRPEFVARAAEECDVADAASWFIKTSIRISSDSASCTIAGTSPCILLKSICGFIPFPLAAKQKAR